VVLSVHDQGVIHLDGTADQRARATVSKLDVV